jgi:hypothetical protein
MLKDLASDAGMSAAKAFVIMASATSTRSAAATWNWRPSTC